MVWTVVFHHINNLHINQEKCGPGDPIDGGGGKVSSYLSQHSTMIIISIIYLFPFLPILFQCWAVQIIYLLCFGLLSFSFPMLSSANHIFVVFWTFSPFLLFFSNAEQCNPHICCVLDFSHSFSMLSSAIIYLLCFGLLDFYLFFSNAEQCNPGPPRPQLISIAQHGCWWWLYNITKGRRRKRRKKKGVLSRSFPGNLDANTPFLIRLPNSNLRAFNRWKEAAIA